jgi:hypothetical protein
MVSGRKGTHRRRRAARHPKGIESNVRTTAPPHVWRATYSPTTRRSAGALDDARALPEWHTDEVRPDELLPGGALDRFELVAKSAFCAPDVATNPGDGAFPDPSGAIWCATVPEAFRSRDHAWPLVGAQFHAEQHDFADAAPGDPPESVAAPRLFLTAVYEEVVDAYERFAP